MRQRERTFDLTRSHRSTERDRWLTRLAVNFIYVFEPFPLISHLLLYKLPVKSPTLFNAFERPVCRRNRIAFETVSITQPFLFSFLLRRLIRHGRGWNRSVASFNPNLKDRRLNLRRIISELFSTDGKMKSTSSNFLFLPKLIVGTCVLTCPAIFSVENGFNGRRSVVKTQVRVYNKYVRAVAAAVAGWWGEEREREAVEGGD